MDGWWVGSQWANGWVVEWMDSEWVIGVRMDISKVILHTLHTHELILINRNPRRKKILFRNSV